MSTVSDLSPLEAMLRPLVAEEVAAQLAPLVRLAALLPELRELAEALAAAAAPLGEGFMLPPLAAGSARPPGPSYQSSAEALAAEGAQEARSFTMTVLPPGPSGPRRRRARVEAPAPEAPREPAQVVPVPPVIRRRAAAEGATGEGTPAAESAPKEPKALTGAAALILEAAQRAKAGFHG